MNTVGRFYLLLFITWQISSILLSMHTIGQLAGEYSVNLPQLNSAVKNIKTSADEIKKEIQQVQAIFKSPENPVNRIKNIAQKLEKLAEPIKRLKMQDKAPLDRIRTALADTNLQQKVKEEFSGELRQDVELLFGVHNELLNQLKTETINPLLSKSELIIGHIQSIMNQIKPIQDSLGKFSGILFSDVMMAAINGMNAELGKIKSNLTIMRNDKMVNLREQISMLVEQVINNPKNIMPLAQALMGSAQKTTQYIQQMMGGIDAALKPAQFLIALAKEFPQKLEKKSKNLIKNIGISIATGSPAGAFDVPAYLKEVTNTVNLMKINLKAVLFSLANVLQPGAHAAQEGLHAFDAFKQHLLIELLPTNTKKALDEIFTNNIPNFNKYLENLSKAI